MNCFTSEDLPSGHTITSKINHGGANASNEKPRISNQHRERKPRKRERGREPTEREPSTAIFLLFKFGQVELVVGITRNDFHQEETSWLS